MRPRFTAERKRRKKENCGNIVEWVVSSMFLELMLSSIKAMAGSLVKLPSYWTQRYKWYSWVLSQEKGILSLWMCGLEVFLSREGERKRERHARRVASVACGHILASWCHPTGLCLRGSPHTHGAEQCTAVCPCLWAGLSSHPFLYRAFAGL